MKYFLTKREGQSINTETARKLCELSAIQMFFDAMRHYRKFIDPTMKEETQEIINKAGNRISHLSKYLGLAARVEPHKDHDLFFSKPVATDFADFVKKGMAEGVTIDLKYIPSGASTYEDIRINMLRIGAPSEMLAALDEALLQYQV